MSTSDEAAVARATAPVEVPAAALDAIARDFTRQMARGLVGEPSSLRMLRTFTRQPSGRERGRVVAVDWGGTKGRASLVELAGDGAVRAGTEDAFTFSEALKRGPAERVFDALAAAVGRIVDAQPPAEYPLGLAYSYPARIERLDRALALPLTKGWNLTGLEGQDVAALLNDALERRGLGRLGVRAVANDTVAALVLAT
ncbi:MAG: hexokinase family protein, partial [Candidatus Rokuibacteriota bacterium]